MGAATVQNNALRRHSPRGTATRAELELYPACGEVGGGWEQKLTVEQIHHLMMSRAFYLRTHDKQRKRMHDNLNWYLLEHLELWTLCGIRLPYVTAAWRMERTELGASG